MSKTYPSEDAISQNNIDVADLPAKTQKLIEKFKAEEDEDKKEALDEKIFSDIDDYLEAKKEKEKKPAPKAAPKKINVSKAPTATDDDEEEEDGEESSGRNGSGTFMDRMLGRNKKQ